MRRIFLLLLIICFSIPCAWAEQTYTLGDLQRGVHYVCTDFDSEMPADVAEIFGSLMREGDEVICGSRGQARSRLEEIRWDSILMAVRREEKMLLLGAYRRGGEWETCVETDGFIPEGTEFDITYLPEEIGEKWSIPAGHAIVCGSERYRMQVKSRGRISWVLYTKEQPDGSMHHMETYETGLSYYQILNGQKLDLGFEHCSVPTVLSAWTMDTIPKNRADQEIWAAEHQPLVNSGEGFICGVNLREQPTGKSRSLGKYSVKVQVLGTSLGAHVPWMHVRFGDTQGWVSGDYFVDGSTYDVRFYGSFVSCDPFARADQETMLYEKAGGNEKARIPAGTLMHVFHQDEDWLHVIIPDGKIGWQTNWNGTYGFVRKGDVTVGETLADLRWK